LAETAAASRPTGDGEAALAPETPGVPLSDWVRIAGACLAVVVIAVLAALAIGTRGDKVYGARADILYAAPDAPLDVRERSLATQRELARSRAVLAAAADQSHVPLQQLEDAVSVETGVRDDLLHITVSDRSRAVARRLTQAVATSYLQLAGRVEATGPEDPLALQRKIDALRAQARRASRAKLARLRERIGRLQERLVSADEGAGAGLRMRLLSPAYPLASPLSPRPVRAAAVGLLIGLLLATAVAVLLARGRVRRRAA
jgi:capsular polysaccharide biosynthesis protein